MTSSVMTYCRRVSESTTLCIGVGRPPWGGRGTRSLWCGQGVWPSRDFMLVTWRWHQRQHLSNPLLCKSVIYCITGKTTLIQCYICLICNTIKNLARMKMTLTCMSAWMNYACQSCTVISMISDVNNDRCFNHMH